MRGGAGARAHAESTFRNFQDEDYRTEGFWFDRRSPIQQGKNICNKKFDGRASDSFFLFPGIADHCASTKLPAHAQQMGRRTPGGPRK